MKGVVLTESGRTEAVEGNHYFLPSGSVNPSLFRENEVRPHCPWRDEASHYDVEVEGAAKNTKDHAVFTATRCE